MTKPIFDDYDPNYIWDRLKLAHYAKEHAFYHPREGQPDLSISVERGGIGVWFKEYLLRAEEIRRHFTEGKDEQVQ